jgi:hypothetical protein
MNSSGEHRSRVLDPAARWREQSRIVTIDCCLTLADRFQNARRARFASGSLPL